MVLYLHACWKRCGERTDGYGRAAGNDVPQDPGVPSDQAHLYGGLLERRGICGRMRRRRTLATATSTQTETSSPARSSIIQTPTSGRRRLSGGVPVRPCSWATMTTSRGMRIMLRPCPVLDNPRQADGDRGEEPCQEHGLPEPGECKRVFRQMCGDC